MIAFPRMLVGAAKEAGMKHPETFDKNSDGYGFDKDAYPHFFIFCHVQLCRRMSNLGEHWDNAKIIATIPEAELKTVTINDLVNKGLSIQFN